MLYDYLHEFSVVAQEGSFSRAAETLSLSQPTLGRHMDALETHLGTTLLMRDARGVRLTAEGRFVCDMAMDMVSIGESIEDRLSGKLAQRDGQVIVIGGLTTSALARKMFFTASRALQNQQADVTVRYLDDCALAAPAQSLMDESVDIVLTYRAAAEAIKCKGEIRRTKLFDSTADVIVEQRHPLSDLDSVRLFDLRDFRMGHLSGVQRNGNVEWEEFKRNCFEKGFAPLSKVVAYNLSPGWGDWYMPELVLPFASDTHDSSFLVSKGKVKIPIEDAIYEVCALTRVDDSLANKLIDHAIASGK